MMAGESFLPLIATAVALLVVGHLIRVARWALLMHQVDRPSPFTGFLALSLGYVVNAILPLRLGELVRAFYYASRTRADAAYVLATVIVERAFDLITVWAILLVMFGAGGRSDLSSWGLMFATAGTVAGIFFAAALVPRSAAFRRIVWHVATIFNPRIRLVILDTTWSLVEVMREIGTNWVRLALQTAAMWTAYLMSYALLAQAIEMSFAGVFDIILGAPLTPAVVTVMERGSADAIAGLLIYTLAPFVLVLGYSAAKRRFGVSVQGAVAWISNPLLYVQSSTHSRRHFAQAEQYGGFLTRRFSGTSDLISDFEMHAINDAIVQRMFRGGSDALTAMVQVGNELRVRKYALGGAARKLEAQCRWLEEHSSDLPLVRITGQARSDARFQYDMEYSRTSRDLFDTIHTYDVGTSWHILSDLMDSIATLHDRTRTGEAETALVERYAAEKVAGNLATIRAAFPMFFEDERVLVNGVNIDLALLDRFAESDFLLSRLQMRKVATIHGDLTIENVLTDTSRASGWFLIDPNIGNIFESPLLDYAKLLQSLHLGYESLNRDVACRYADRALTFPIARTAQYAVLHTQAVGWMRDRFGEGGFREIRLHEIIHYYRLTPYKFRKGAHAGLVFLGCLSLLVQRYFDEFETC